jgi:SPP1 family predicted phage head-tail adaptor
MSGIGTRKPIQIISVTPEKEESTGLMKPTETVLFSGWAQVTNPSGGRNYFIGQDSLDHTKFFKIRHTQGITSDVNTRLIYAGKRYTVNSIERDNEKKFYWNIRATAKTDN